MKKTLRALLLSAFALALLPASASAAVCTDISLDLSQKSTGAKVTALQNFLKSSGYLSAEPNGYFGTATLSAVKKYQSASGIDATGYVGPMTRSSIKAKSCTSAAVPEPTAPASSVPSTPVSSSFQITRPESGQTLVIGKEFTIRWKSEPKGAYDIILEDENGVAAGYIASNRVGGISHEWKSIGSILSGSDTKIVPQGNYRIRIRPTTFGSSEEIASGIFRLDGPSLQVISIVPTNPPNNVSSSILLYGRGFTSATSVYLDGIRTIKTARQYVSPDGRFLLFSLSEPVSPGAHIISLRNAYDEIQNAGTVIFE